MIALHKTFLESYKANADQHQLYDRDRDDDFVDVFTDDMRMIAMSKSDLDTLKEYPYVFYGVSVTRNGKKDVEWW